MNTPRRRAGDGPFATVKPDGLNVHYEPNFGSCRVTALARGDLVRIVQRLLVEDVWWAELDVVATANGNTAQVGTTGWVREDLLEARAPAPLPPDVPIAPAAPESEPLWSQLRRDPRFYVTASIAGAFVVAAFWWALRSL